jgi:uncharacterized repeat protein (TIGR03803 family)
MKTRIKAPFLLTMLIAVCVLTPAGQVTAQIFTTLHSFTATSGIFSNNTNGDGAVPEAGLILSGDTLYGTAYDGGGTGYGTLFAITTNGMVFSNLHSFTNGNDGDHPVGDLTLSGDTLYGTANAGGSAGNGTIFAIGTGGTNFASLYNFAALNNFTNSDGANPQAGLILSGNTLYGTANAGGSAGNGTVFAIITNGELYQPA